MGKKIKSLVSSLTGGLLGGGDDGAAKAQKAAAEAQARANASAEAARMAQENMQKNFAADLKQENVGQVVAGGTAEELDLGDALKKKKSTASGLASSLGINV